MSDSSLPPSITKTKLNNGSVVQVNDHVYLAPEHLGEPYYIGRIMEFCTLQSFKGLQARIAWFNRQKDVTNRKSNDPCLLVATMHSDLNPVSSIRGKCSVTHRHYIPNEQLEQYRAQENNFYYTQMYDRYIQRIYDVVPVDTIQNVPMDVQIILNQRYEFVVIEQGKAADLTAARRICCVCQDWCASETYVKCAPCHKNFHMSCLNPPLTKKPSKGFAWQCAFCSRKDLEDDPHTDSDIKSPGMSSKSLQGARKQRQTRQTAKQLQKSVHLSPPNTISRKDNDVKASQQHKNSHGSRMTNMWPFRYFGTNTNIKEILDINDRIYPRAQSRIGSRYQANVFDWDKSNKGQSSTAPDRSSSQERTNKGKSKRLERKGRLTIKKKISSPQPSSTDIMENTADNIPVRGTNETVTPIFQPALLSDITVADEYMNNIQSLQNLPLAFHSTDLQDRALIELNNSNYNSEKALIAMDDLKQDDFEYIANWSSEEIATFEQSIKEHGHDLQFASKKLPGKSMPDVVRFFYLWKKTDRYEHVYSEWTKIFRPTKTFKRQNLSTKEGSGDNRENTETDFDNGEGLDLTIIPSIQEGCQCSNCFTTTSDIWRRSPFDTDRKRKIFKQALCNDCGIHWLKYGTAKTINDNVKASRGKGRPVKLVVSGEAVISPSRMGMKRKKTSADITKETIKRMKDENKKIFPPSPCKVCLQMHCGGQLLVCQECGISVHDDCYGAETTDERDNWMCDVCENKKTPSASYIYECVLCYEGKTSPCQALKKTSGYNWVHVTCSMFLPEVKFNNTTTFRTAEFVGMSKAIRQKLRCELCSGQPGACITCGACNKPVHVQCAIRNNYYIGFDIQAGTVPYAATIEPGLFDKMPGGVMMPQVFCAEHDISQHNLMDLTTRTADTNESCIRTYARLYKKLESGTTPAMRRYLSATTKPGTHPPDSSMFKTTCQPSTSYLPSSPLACCSSSQPIHNISSSK